MRPNPFKKIQTIYINKKYNETASLISFLTSNVNFFGRLDIFPDRRLERQSSIKGSYRVRIPLCLPK